MTLTAFFMVEKSMINPKLGKRMITISPTASYRASTGFWVCMLCVHVSSDTHLYLPPPMPLQKAICFLLQPFHLYRDQIHHIQARCFSKFWKSCFASSETCLLSVGLTSGWRSLIVQRRGFPDLQRVHRICKLDHGDIAALFMQVSKGGSNTRWLFNRSFRRGVDNCALKTPNSHSKTFFDWVTYPWVEWLSACGKRWARSMFALWLHAEGGLLW